MMDSIKQCARWLEEADKIVVLTGAGMSTESGIPDFRSSGGLYNQKNQTETPLEEVLSRSFFEKNPSQFYQFYKDKLLYPGAEPNAGHLFLGELEERGHDVTIITQNIDGLHQKAGNRKVLELHGSTRRVVDQSGKSYPVDLVTEFEDKWLIGETWVRPDIVLYGEMLNMSVISESSDAIRQADCLLVMGTSLNVYPAAGLIFDYMGQKSMLVNKEPTQLNHFFSQVFISSISQWVNQIETCLN